MKNNKPLLQLHIAIFLWGFTGVLGNLINLNEIWIVWYRLLITAVTLIIINICTHKVLIITHSQKLQIAMAGCLQALHWVCFFASVKYANVAVALICLSSTSFFTAMLEAILYQRKVNVIELSLSAVAIVGIIFIFYADFSFSKGIYFGIASALLIAVVPILNKQQLKVTNAQTVTMWSILGGLVIVSILLPIYTSFIHPYTAVPSLPDWLWLLVLSWLCTIVTWRLSFAALQKISAFTQNLLLNLEPVYGILFAVIILKEYKQYNTYFYIGISCIILTVVLQTMLIKANKNGN